MTKVLRRIAQRIAAETGSPWALAGAFVVIGSWFAAGFLFGFSEQMQLYINTGTTIVTFIMVFAIQGSSNNDTRSIHAKLDEILIKHPDTRSEVAGIERLDEQEQAEVIGGTDD